MNPEPCFIDIAATLRAELERHFARRRRPQDPEGIRRTIATNSDLVPERGKPLIRMLSDAGMTSLTGKRVIDLGCGFGSLAAYLAAHGAALTGVDIEPQRFSVGRAAAAEHGLHLDLLERPMEDLPPDLIAYDAAIMNNTLCYLVDPQIRLRALRGVRAALRPGGLLLIRDLNGWHPIDQFTRIPLLPLLDADSSGWIAGRLRRRRPYVQLVSPRVLAAEVRAAGFLDVRHLSDSLGLYSRASRNVARYQHVVASS